ncbi:MAG: class I SAM-dependent methyltransferase [Acidobacteria bacterium]|nr:class I SAM-dependent methyltransferase [Acidobacteriota bacterium]
MSNRTIQVDDRLYDYILSVSLREHDVLRRLRAETSELGALFQMQISPEQGQLMFLLARLVGARQTLEVGVFTGYSALSVALALPEDGCVVACDVSEEWTSIGRRYWAEAGVAHKIDLRLAPAIETLDALIAEGRKGSFDFAFIDADKVNYANYFERALVLLRQGGLIAIDNTLWSGRVADASVNDDDTVAIRKFNESLHHDDRFSLSLLPIGDGLTLAMKR